MKDKIRLGVSRCVFGEKVRYDGGHKYSPFLEEIALDFELEPVCPEAECGMSIPREPAHIGGSPMQPTFMGNLTGKNYTFQLMTWVQDRIQRFHIESVFGYVFKSGSPSCAAVEKLPVYNGEGGIRGYSHGLFALEFMRTFPLVPVVDDIGLAQPLVREKFLSEVEKYHKSCKQRM